MKRVSLIQVILATVLAGGSLLAQPLPDAKFLLDHSEDEFKKHKTYRIEMETFGSANGIIQPPVLASVFGIFPDRARAETKTMTIVVDGQYTWGYAPSSGQYTRIAAIGNVLDGIIGPSKRAWVESVRSAFLYKTVRQEKLEIDGQVIDCWVIETKAEHLPLPEGAPSISSPEASGYDWIDKDSGLKRQTVATATFRLPNSGASQSVEMRIVYHVKFDEPLPDSLFQFTPPSGAKEVSDIFNMPNLAGKAAPAFEVVSLDGKNYNLSELRSKVVLLEFWASWCKPCRQDILSINSLYRDLKEKNLLVIAVNVGEDRQTVQNFLKAAGISFPVALTSGTDIASDYHVTSYPTYIVIGRNGMVAGEQVGGLGYQPLRDLVAKGYGNDFPGDSNLATVESDAKQAESAIPALMRLRDDRTRRDIDLVTVNTRLVKAWEILTGPESSVVANNLYSLSGSLKQAGRLPEAEQAIRRSIAILEKNYGTTAPSVGFARRHLLAIETKLGKDDPANQAANRESEIRQQGSAQNAFRGGPVTAPRVISKGDPRYSDKARRARIQGTVMISLVVNTEGKPDNIAVLLPLGEGLDEMAVEAVKAWRFQPGTKDGHPVSVGIVIDLNFRLL